MDTQRNSASTEISAHGALEPEKQATHEMDSNLTLVLSDEDMQLILMHVEQLSARPAGLCQGS